MEKVKISELVMSLFNTAKVMLDGCELGVFHIYESSLGTFEFKTNDGKIVVSVREEKEEVEKDA